MLEGLWSGNCVMRMKIRAYSEEKKLFSLNWCLGPFLISIAHTGQSCGAWSGCAGESSKRLWCLGGLSGASDQLLCFVSISIILFMVESTHICAKLVASRSRDRIASVSCAEAASKGSFPTLTTLTGLVICSVVVYLLVTKSHALHPVEAVKMCYQSVYCIS